MFNQDMVIIWRDVGCEYRSKHFNFIKNYYQDYFNIIVADSNHEEFNRADSRNIGVEASTSDVVIIIDADAFININQIMDACKLAKEKDVLVRPFSRAVYLSEDATERFYNNPNIFTDSDGDYVYMTPDQLSVDNFGGAFVIKKKLWNDLGGMDKNFIGWGGEDNAFLDSYHLKFGTSIKILGNVYSLYHPIDRVVSTRNLMLYYLKYKNEHSKLGEITYDAR